MHFKKNWLQAIKVDLCLKFSGVPELRTYMEVYVIYISFIFEAMEKSQFVLPRTQ